MKTSRGEITIMVAMMVVMAGAVIIFGHKIMGSMMGAKHDHQKQTDSKNNTSVDKGERQ